MGKRKKEPDEPSELEKARREKGTLSPLHQSLNAVAGIGRDRHRKQMHEGKHTRIVVSNRGLDENGEPVVERTLFHTTKTPPWKKRAKNRQRRKNAR